MQVESRKNKNAKRLNSVRGTQRFTKPSQTNGGANIRINSETTIPKLKNLAKKYIGVSNPYGFLTDLQNALGIPNSKAMIYNLVQLIFLIASCIFRKLHHLPILRVFHYNTVVLDLHTLR